MKSSKETAVENFLSSMDMQLSMTDHFSNCLRDAVSYGWNTDTLREIMSGIEDAYQKKEEK